MEASYKLARNGLARLYTGNLGSRDNQKCGLACWLSRDPVIMRDFVQKNFMHCFLALVQL